MKKKIMPNIDIFDDDGDEDENDDADDIPSTADSEPDLRGLDDLKTPMDLTTPDVLNGAMFDGELEWRGQSAVSPVEPIPEYSAKEEFDNEKNWRTVELGDKTYRIDMKAIEPYKKIISHGGYYGDGFNAIIVFAGCYLPDRSRLDYQYVMDHLFLYVVSTLELLVVDDYMVVYFHGATPKNKMPSFRWLRRCYDLIDRRLKKNLKALLIVHPTFWLKTVVWMTRFFISSKFTSKLKYVKSLQHLTEAVPTEYIFIPDEVKQYDECRQKSSKSPATTPST
eukprot:GHVU01153197.1.p1 GENE.GHVU01153197.1~~GHVU01153197.1.p1  ORF type:complete len:321 (-),score=44.79 GHVU01153197.1:3039-3878(-)